MNKLQSICLLVFIIQINAYFANKDIITVLGLAVSGLGVVYAGNDR